LLKKNKAPKTVYSAGAKINFIHCLYLKT